MSGNLKRTALAAVAALALGAGVAVSTSAPADAQQIWRPHNGGGWHGVFIVKKGGGPRTGHQTQKSLALMELLVRLFSDPGELTLDPIAGSGTTGVAAIRLGRRFLGWDGSDLSNPSPLSNF